MDEFDGILDGENMIVTIVVDEIDHGRQRGALARARGTRHQHQASGHHGDVFKDLTHVQVFHREHLGWNGPEYRAGAAVLVERVDSEAGNAGHLEGEIGLQKLLEVLALLVIHDLVDQRVNFGMLERGQIDPANVAVYPNHGR